MSKPKLYLDEDIRPLLAEILRQRGYDTIHVIQVNRQGKSDAEQLAFAINDQRVIVTHNVRDYIILAKEYQLQGNKHCGIVVSDQLMFKELLKRITKCLHNNSKEDFENRFIWLNNYR